MGIIKKVKKIKDGINPKVAKVIASLLVVSSLGLIIINTDEVIKVGILDGEDVYITQETTWDDFINYIDMINYEIEQDGGEVVLEDIKFINGVASEKSVMAKLNYKFSRREPNEISDEKEKKKYKLSRDILMKKSEGFSVEYLIELFESEEPVSNLIIK